MAIDTGRPRQYNDVRVSQIRMEPIVMDKVKYIAAHEGRSMNGQLTFWARTMIAKYEQEHGPIKLEDEY